MMKSSPVPQVLSLRATEYVQVRSKEEILSTLDKNGRLGEMPFMPEMLKYCGQTLQVSKRAHKTCDPINGLDSRRLPDAVHLEDLRCDGSAHAGCQAGCLFFWKEAWLKRPSDKETGTSPSPAPSGVCDERDLYAGTRAAGEPENAENPTFVCQATQVAAATVTIKWWDLRQYLEDYRSGNATVFQMFCALVFETYHYLTGLGLGLGAAMRWLYDTFQKAIGGSPYPWRKGKLPRGARTPTTSLGVQEGEFVKIKTYSEILETLDLDWKNRGLYFDAEMVPYTGGTFKVLKRVKRIIHEKTGALLDFKTEALILDKVTCQARYAQCRKMCPRAYYLYWREIWVNRAPAPCQSEAPQSAKVSASARCGEPTAEAMAGAGQ